MDAINIAIIGANGVGKSTFMQRALKLSAPPTQPIVTFNWTESDGTQHTVNTIEVDLDAFDLEMNEPIRWPRQANGQMTPRVDGTMVLYDVTSEDSINMLPQTLCESAFACLLPAVPTRARHGSLTIRPRSCSFRVKLPHAARRDKM